MFTPHIKKTNKEHQVEASTLPDQFILTSRTAFPRHPGRVLDQQRDVCLHNTRTETRHSQPRWNLKGIPSLTGTADQRHAAHPRVWAREDTFDQDFMMPGRVREILESEGLEHGVIDTAIGRAEKRHRKALRTMAEQQWLPLPIKDIQLEENTTKQCSTEESTASHLAGVCVDKLGRNRNLAELTDPFDKDEKLNESIPQATVDHYQLEADRAKWVSDQHAERLFVGNKFVPPRIVLVSSKVTKCHLLSKVFLEDGVVPITYDFETWSLTDILDAVSQKLDKYRRNCRARSIMVLCQGGPGYIYLIRNYAITPQKLNKPSYRGVVEFWKRLGNLVSKLDPSEAAIHLFGFTLMDNEQGAKLLPMLQGLMYPNRVKMEASTDDTDAGRAVAERYFKYSRYKIWKMHQDTSVTEIDFELEAGNIFPMNCQRKQSKPKLYSM